MANLFLNQKDTASSSIERFLQPRLATQRQAQIDFFSVAENRQGNAFSRRVSEKQFFQFLDRRHLRTVERNDHVVNLYRGVGS